MSDQSLTHNIEEGNTDIDLLKEELAEQLLSGKPLAKLSVQNAIKIARVIAYCPKERLPMVLDVFGKANIEIEGYEEYLEISYKGKIANLDKVAEALMELGRPHKDKIIVEPAAVNRYCSEHKLSSRAVKQQLYHEGYIMVQKHKNSITYSATVYIDGTNKRFIVFYDKGDKKEQNGEE